MLCRREALDFHFAALQGNLEAAKAELRKRAVAFQDCDGFLPGRTTPAEPAGQTPRRLGKALVAQRSHESGSLVLVDSPFLVVSNPDGLERWIRRWDCYYEIMKMAQAGQRELLDSFEAMDDGGEDVVQSLCADAGETLKLLWQAAGDAQQANIPEVVKEREKLKVAKGFARWQTNQHEFPAFLDQQRRALYWLAPKVAHSCDPNVGWEDPSEDGRVELRALRRIASGEVLGVNYMNQSFLLQPVEVRRSQLLRERKFHCVCQRCVKESESGSEPPRGALAAAREECSQLEATDLVANALQTAPEARPAPEGRRAAASPLEAALRLLAALQHQSFGPQVGDALRQLQIPRELEGEEAPLADLVEQLNRALRDRQAQNKSPQGEDAEATSPDEFDSMD